MWGVRIIKAEIRWLTVSGILEVLEIPREYLKILREIISNEESLLQVVKSSSSCAWVQPYLHLIFLGKESKYELTTLRAWHAGGFLSIYSESLYVIFCIPGWIL